MINASNKNISIKYISHNKGDEFKSPTKRRLAAILFAGFFSVTHANTSTNTVSNDVVGAEEAYRDCALQVSKNADKDYELSIRKYPQGTSMHSKIKMEARNTYEKSLDHGFVECKKKRFSNSDKGVGNDSITLAYTMNGGDLNFKRDKDHEIAALKFNQRNQVHRIAFEFENLIRSFEVIESQFVGKRITSEVFKREKDRISSSMDSVAGALVGIKPEILDKKSLEIFQNVVVLEKKLRTNIDKL